MTWELIWMLVILKIPVIYLCLVVWWAIRAEPQPLEPALRSAASRARPEARTGGSRGSARGGPAVGRTGRPPVARVRAGGPGRG